MKRHSKLNQQEVEERLQSGDINRVPPKVAIVIDDLGPNRKAILPLLDIKVPLTLSILPHETYSSWIAEEGHKRGHDIITHIPMEAKKGNNLGKGGLYTWMSEENIRTTMDKNLHAVPYIKGVSSHMGSAFTEDERAMYVVMSVLKKESLFFLDSLTTPDSAGEKTAGAGGIRILKRDVFLDNRDDAAYMEEEWKKLVRIAQRNGFAIALAHPRERTITFLEKIIKREEVTVVPLSRLAGMSTELTEMAR